MSLEDTSIHDVDLNGGAFVLANEHDILRTIGNEEESLINIVYPNIISSVDDDNESPMIHVLLNIPKNDDDESEFQNVNELIDIIRTEDDGDARDILLQSTESINLPSPVIGGDSEKEKLLAAIIDEEKVKSSFLNADDIHQSDSFPSTDRGQSSVFCQTDGVPVEQSIILDDFVEKVIVTKYKCKFCTFSFDSPEECQEHLLTQHIKFQPQEDTIQAHSEIPHDNSPLSDTISIVEPELTDTCSEPTLQAGKKAKANSKPIEPVNVTAKRKRKVDKSNSHKRFPCDLCDYIARHRVHLRDHRFTHTGERPFRCIWEDCGQSFTQASALRTHMRTHTGEKPYPCPWPACSKFFAQKNNIIAHMRTHTGERPFSCDWPGCESSFTNKSNLDDHRRVHIDDKIFVCDHPGCSVRFMQKAHLRRHQAVHQSKKAFACDWPGCQYRCHRQADIVTHKKLHTGEKKYACELCQKKFSRSSHLKNHLADQHSPDTGNIEKASATDAPSFYLK